MSFFRWRKLRFLYLLALVQLVGGPLVLLQVTVFCKLTLNETPRIGMAKAAIEAWKSEGFQSALTERSLPEKNGRKEGDGKKPEKAKQMPLPWNFPAGSPDVLRNGSQSVAENEVTWTPLWPNAPPGPPPRLV